MKLPDISRYIRAIPGSINRQRGAIFTGLLIGFGALFLLQLWQFGQHLDDLGAEGDHQAQVWGLPVDILSALQAPIGFLITVWLYKKGYAFGRDAGRPEPRKLLKPNLTWAHFVTAAACASVAFFVPLAVSKFAFGHWEKENITTKIHLSSNSRMQNGSTANASLPATAHQHLKIKFRLESQTSSGSCVAPARLTIVPAYNGNNGKKVFGVRSGVWQDIALGAVADKTMLELTLDLSEEPSCVLKLNVDSAFYSR